MATVKDGKGVLALAVFKGDESLKLHEFGRPAPGPHGVAIDIKYSGMCHSDVHACDGSWGVNKWPLAPGHEIAGLVTAVGAEVEDLKVGDRVGVGCMVESCRECDLCKEGLEQHCPGMIQTYSSDFPKGREYDDAAGHYTNGGYSQKITVDRRFVFKVPDSLELPYVAPLLCAGITTYSPLNRYVKGQANKSVGVVGFGGLGHVAVKIAVAMGAKVTVYSRSTSKAEAAERLGAKLVSHQDADALKALARTQDVILDTVSADHQISDIVANLKVGGRYVAIGGVTKPYEISAMALLFNRHSVEGSLIGGVPETAEMLEFCAEHKVLPDIDIIHAKDAAAAFTLLQSGGAPPARHVIDMSTIAELK